MSEIPPDFKREMLSLLPNLRAFAISLCGSPDRADDLVQDAILKAWAAHESFEAGTNLKAWLFTILRNEFYSQMRKKGREIQDSEGYYTENMAVHPSQYGRLDLQDFSKALAELPEDQREALRLRYVEVAPTLAGSSRRQGCLDRCAVGGWRRRGRGAAMRCAR